VDARFLFVWKPIALVGAKRSASGVRHIVCIGVGLTSLWVMTPGAAFAAGGAKDYEFLVAAGGVFEAPARTLGPSDPSVANYTLDLVAQAQIGTVEIRQEGSFVYTAAKAAPGAGQFTYKVIAPGPVHHRGPMA
jgi:hypothetical protein